MLLLVAVACDKPYLCRRCARDAQACLRNSVNLHGVARGSRRDLAFFNGQGFTFPAAEANEKLRALAIKSVKAFEASQRTVYVQHPEVLVQTLERKKLPTGPAATTLPPDWPEHDTVVFPASTITVIQGPPPATFFPAPPADPPADPPAMPPPPVVPPPALPPPAVPPPVTQPPSPAAPPVAPPARSPKRSRRRPAPLSLDSTPASTTSGDAVRDRHIATIRERYNWALAELWEAAHSVRALAAREEEVSGVPFRQYTSATGLAVPPALTLEDLARDDPAAAQLLELLQFRTAEEGPSA
ncbi:hypothetical protein L226DRAFT_522616 [Lentinus tigrinus ALCF2SS1-7]|uniref:uncharacterized protein n=1 Tax=Lentinus tigrinus ALCF2SS1-7 TaxID=1328758 RepID=UPI0011661A8A|nr:hypothetical protein L226DRAFT_522616 [Lentinus tigrinus ALCF2SS1-7]